MELGRVIGTARYGPRYARGYSGTSAGRDWLA